MYNATKFAKIATFSAKQAASYLNVCKNVFRWKKNETMLEIGCADGFITRTVLYPFVKTHLNHLHAVDVFPNAVETAKSTNDNERISFAVMDITKEIDDVHKSKYDHVFLLYVLMLVPHDAWAKNVHSLIKPGGQVFGSILLDPNPNTIVFETMKSDKTKPWSKYYDGYDGIFQRYGDKPKEFVTNILTQQRFNIDFIDVVQRQSVLPSKEAVKGMGHAVNPFPYRLPEEMRAEYYEEYYERYVKEFNEKNDGTYVSDVNALLFVATKQ